MGDDWIKMAGNRLYNLQGKSEEGDVIGSSIDIGIAIATFCPEISLITGQQLLGMYKQAGNKNPFGGVYIDFGVQVNGKPDIYSSQAKVLLDDFKAREIKIGEGRVPGFAQLRLQADKDAGLVYRLVENVSAENIDDVSAYPFGSRVGKDGLFGAYLLMHDWYANDEGLQDSVGVGRLVRYDAEGVARAKPRTTIPNLVDTLTAEFSKKFESPF